jgi:DNA-binding transcriptional ArsR family regulator
MYKCILIYYMADTNPFEALSSPTRRALFEMLREGPRSVNELANALPVSQPAVSQHLQVLRSARLARVEKRGQQRIYSIDREGLAELRSYVEGLWDQVLDAFERAATESILKEGDDE